MSSSVVIVGAGLSGLSSALHLLDLGTVPASSIIVLEGRSRVGGRLLAHKGRSLSSIHNITARNKCYILITWEYISRGSIGAYVSH